jgi:CBS domain-containing protein
VPVIDSTASRRLIGIVTDRDIVVKVLADGRDVRSARAEDAMTSGPTACREDQDIGDAVHQMAERQVRRIPVVDAEGRLSGIIAQADVATRVNRDRTTGMLVEAISEPVPQRKPV